jgi:hypothetical protein
MSAGPIPESLRRFILTSVPSVPFVEAVLIFRDVAPATVTVTTLASRLYVDLQRGAEIVEQLTAAQIVERVEDGTGYRYAPAGALAGTLDDLAAHYRSNLVEVAGLIHSSTGRMAHRFADAFKWRKD